MQESFWKFYQKLGFPWLFKHHFPCNNNNTIIIIIITIINIIITINTIIILYTLSTMLPIVLK